MDGSILSEKRLLKASRDFVCARLVTYESAEEGDFLSRIGGSGKYSVANTAFVLLAPDGETALTRSGRSPKQVFRGSEEDNLDGIIQAMKRIAKQFPGNEQANNSASVPYVVDVRRGLNVAACDNQPLVIVAVDNEQKRMEMEQGLAQLAWEPDYRGRFAFAKAVEADDIAKIINAPKRESVFVVQPGTYGLEGKTIAMSVDADLESLRKMLDQSMVAFNKQPMTRAETRAGVRNGIEWEAETLEHRVAPKRGGRRGGR